MYKSKAARKAARWERQAHKRIVRKAPDYLGMFGTHYWYQQLLAAHGKDKANAMTYDALNSKHGNWATHPHNGCSSVVIWNQTKYCEDWIIASAIRL